MNHTTLITDSDLDGGGCAVLVDRALGHGLFDIIYSNPEAVTDDVQIFLHRLDCEKGMHPHQLIISDLCPIGSVVEELRARAQEDDFDVVIADHHDSTVWLNSYEEENLIHGNDRCGTLLIHGWLKSLGLLEDMDGSLHFAKTVDAYDRWLLKDPLRQRGEVLNRLFWFVGRDSFVEAFVEDWNAESSHLFRRINGFLLDQEQRAVDDIIDKNLNDQNVFADREGRRFLFLPVGKYASQVGNAILEDDESLDYVVMLNVAYGNVSLRARKGGVDVSQIAERFKGGGHKVAAGFPLPVMEALRVFVAKLI